MTTFHLSRRARTKSGLIGLAVAGALVLAACSEESGTTNGSANIDCKTGTLQAAGSSAQANAMSEWVKAYQTACPDATINYQSIGSGAGIQQFLEGTTDFAGSDSALKDDEAAKAKERCGSDAVNLPMVIGPIALGFNVPDVSALKLTPQTIAGIFDSSITKWNDPKLVADNPDAKLPDLAIQAFHRSDSSGTTDNFTKYLTSAAGDAWKYEPGKEWRAPGGQGAKGSEGVSGAVKQTAGSIGYMELSYAESQALGMAEVKNASGSFVKLTPDSAAATVSAAKVVGTGNDLKLAIDYKTTESSAYPIVLVTYEITCQSGNDNADLLKSFLAYTASSDGQEVIGGLGYAPLASDLAAKVATAAGSLT